MTKIDVKRGSNASRRPEEQASPRGAQTGGAGQRRAESDEATRRSQGREAGGEGLTWTRGRSGTGLSRETGGWGWPSRSLFAMNPMELWSAGPFELMRRMSNEMDRMFPGLPTSGMAAGAGWMPAVEVAERDGKLVVTAELPGLSEKDVRVEARDEGLVIEGERTREHEETSGGVYRSERSYGSFRRVIPLPEDAQIEQAQARFTNGVLEVTVPLPDQSARRRRIPISTAAGGREAPAPEPTGARARATGSGPASVGDATPSEEEVGTRTRG